MSRKKNSVLEKDYYEFFNFAVPVKVLLTGKNKQYLYGELGKLYPCFSEASCFDYRLKFGRKGFSADVVVTEKFILAEYFKNNRSKKIWIPEIKKNCFVKKMIVNKELWIVSALFLLLGIIYGSRLLVKSRKTITAEENPVQNTIQDFKPAGFYLESLFATLLASEAQLQNLKWELNGYKEVITAGISGIKPEVLDLMKVPFSASAVQYKNGNSFCEVKILEKVSIASEIKELTERKGWKEEIRTIIQTKNSALIWEKIDPYCFCFAGECSTVGEKLISINDSLRAAGLSVNSLEISKSKNQLIVEIKTTVEGGGGNILTLMGEYSQLFRIESGESEKMNDKQKKKDVDTEVKEIINTKGNDITRMRKIGEIVHEGGKTIVFYKDKDGKIFTEDKE